MVAEDKVGIPVGWVCEGLEKYLYHIHRLVQNGQHEYTLLPLSNVLEAAPISHHLPLCDACI